MPKPSVAPEIHQPLNVELNLTAEVTLNLEVVLDHLPNAPDVRLGQSIRAQVWIEPTLLHDLLCGGITHPVDIGQSYDDPLFTRKVDTCNTGHYLASGASALALFVARVFTNDPHNTSASDHLTVVTNRLH